MLVIIHSTLRNNKPKTEKRRARNPIGQWMEEHITPHTAQSANCIQVVMLPHAVANHHATPSQSQGMRRETCVFSSKVCNVTISKLNNITDKLNVCNVVLLVGEIHANVEFELVPNWPLHSLKESPSCPGNRPECTAQSIDDALKTYTTCRWYNSNGVSPSP